MSITVRQAGATDLRAVESVRVATWKTAYRGLLSDDLLDRLEVTDQRVASLTERHGAGEVQSLVAELDGEVIGFIATGACRDDDLPTARELWAIYVLPQHWGTGAGHALVQAAGQLDVVWVLKGNNQAIAFYERQGFRLDGATKLVNWLPPPQPVELRLRLG